jgi:hypothetical protein
MIKRQQMAESLKSNSVRQRPVKLKIKQYEKF